MFDGRVLGVDPGVARCGLAVIEPCDRRSVLVWAATIKTATDLEESVRLGRLADAMREVVATHHPSAVAVERIAWNRNQVSALQVARATGALLLVASDAGLPVAEYSPSEVKNAVTGSGNASKGQVAEALLRLHGLRDVPRGSDAADAIAVALTHLVGAPLRAAAARSGAR